MTARFLDPQRVARYEALCDLIVPGSARVGPAVYTEAALAHMPAPLRTAALQAIDALADVQTAAELAPRVHSAEFALVRALAIEAFYSDFVAPGRDVHSAWEEIDFQAPRPLDLERDWSWLGIR